MVSKAMNNQSTANGAGQPKAASRRTTKMRSHVTEARAKAQRARLDSQAEAHHVQEEQETTSPQTLNRKTVHRRRRPDGALSPRSLKPTFRIISAGMRARKRWSGTALLSG